MVPSNLMLPGVYESSTFTEDWNWSSNHCWRAGCFYVGVCEGGKEWLLPPSQHCHVSLLTSTAVLIVLFLSSFFLLFWISWSWFCFFPSQSVMSSLLREEMQRVLFRPGKQRLVEFIEIKEAAQGRHFLCVSGKWLFLWLINIWKSLIPIPAKFLVRFFSVYIFNISWTFLNENTSRNILNVSEP